MTPASPPRSRAPLAIAVAVFAIEMALAPRYGVFRDELYYVACGKHLAFGYVDHPPLVAAMARVTSMALGESVVALRVMPALCAPAIVLLGARFVAVGDFACDDWSNVYGVVRKVDETDEPYAMPYENHIPVCLLKDPKEPLDRVWPRLRHYI
jgi:hypothetical protein